MESLYDKKYCCPICKDNFTSKQVRKSKIKIIEKDKDFRRVYKGENPTFYGVICCKYCGYATLERSFETAGVSNETLIRKVISSNWSEKDFNGKRDIQDAIQLHLVALANYKILKANNSIIGMVKLRLAWYYRELKEEEKEKKYLAEARLNFIESFELENSQELAMKEIEMFYLIGEISKRLDLNKDAIKWFDKTINYEGIKDRVIIGYAREQWAEVSDIERAKRKKNKE